MKPLPLFMTWLLALLASGLASPAAAQEGRGVSVAISQEAVALTAGEWVSFSTTVRNLGTIPTPPLVAHLNIAAVVEGPYVDPEDWAPNRTRYLPPLSPGESAELRWEVHALTAGRFAAFVSLVSTELPFSPAISPMLTLQVAPDNILPLGEVVPVVAVVPLFPLMLLLVTYITGRRRSHRPAGLHQSGKV